MHALIFAAGFVFGIVALLAYLSSCTDLPDEQYGASEARECFYEEALSLK